MSLAAHVLEDYSAGTPRYSANASPLAIVALPANVVGGRELSFNVTFWEAMEDFIVDSGPTLASTAQDRGVDQQNAEETERSVSKKQVPITELIVTNVTPPTKDVMGQIISQAPANAEFAEDSDIIEDDEPRNDAFGFIEDLADSDDQFLDVGMGAFAEQVVD